MTKSSSWIVSPKGRCSRVGRDRRTASTGDSIDSGPNPESFADPQLFTNPEICTATRDGLPVMGRRISMRITPAAAAASTTWGQKWCRRCKSRRVRSPPCLVRTARSLFASSRVKCSGRDAWGIRGAQGVGLVLEARSAIFCPGGLLPELPKPHLDAFPAVLAVLPVGVAG